MSESERGLLEQAAGEAHTSLSDFVRRSALVAAELALMDRTEIVIPAEKWAEFETFMNAPARPLPGLAELAKRTPPWSD